MNRKFNMLVVALVILLLGVSGPAMAKKQVPKVDNFIYFIDHSSSMAFSYKGQRYVQFGGVSKLPNTDPMHGPQFPWPVNSTHKVTPGKHRSTKRPSYTLRPRNKAVRRCNGALTATAAPEGIAAIEERLSTNYSRLRTPHWGPRMTVQAWKILETQATSPPLTGTSHTARVHCLRHGDSTVVRPPQ